VIQPKIYHNPRCSKSRATLELLRERGFVPEIVEYLKDPPTTDELDHLLGLLAMEPRDLARKQEPAYEQAGLADATLGRDEIVRRMVANPSVIERPVVLFRGRAALGRPPEKVIEIL
jgi:arsenate reductase